MGVRARPREDLLALQREVTDLYAGAQADDGYPTRCSRSREGRALRRPKWSHELYCAGHCTRQRWRSTARRRHGLLDVATKNADHLVAPFGDGPGRRRHRRAPVVRWGSSSSTARPAPAPTSTSRTGSSMRGGTDHRARGRRADVLLRPGSAREATTVGGTRSVPCTWRPEGRSLAIETGDTELLARERAPVRRHDCHEGVIRAASATVGLPGFGDPYELPTDRGYAETCARSAGSSGRGGCSRDPGARLRGRESSVCCTTRSSRG